MKFNTDYKSRFRILKGGKISLVVSALLVSSSLVVPAYAGPSLTVSGAETTTQSMDTTIGDLEVTSTGSITITNDVVNTSGLYGTSDIYSGISVSNAGNISISNTTEDINIRGINIGGYNDGDIINTGSGTININNSFVGRDARGIDLNSNSGDITLDGGAITVASKGDADGLKISGNHTGTITNSSTLSATVDTADFNDNAIGINITGNMTNASILNSGTIYSTGNKNQTYGIFVGGTVTDSTITNNYNIETIGTSTSEAYGIFLDGGSAGTTTITNTSNATITATSLDEKAAGIFVNGDSTANEILNSGLIDVTAGTKGYGTVITGDFTGDITNSATIQVSQGSVTEASLYGIKVESTLTGNISNDTFMEIQGNVAYTYGLYANELAVGSTITNSGTIISHSEDYDAIGIYVETSYANITNNSFLNVYSKDGNSSGIKVDYSNGTITNTGTIQSKSIDGKVRGISVSTNEGSIVNNATIDVDSSTDKAQGIRAGGGSGTITNSSSGIINVDSVDDKVMGIYSYNGDITNSGTITVNSTNTFAYGIRAYYGIDITNSGTITAHKDGVLDWSAFSTFIYERPINNGTITNEATGVLNGNIFTAGTLINEGTINLPHNANTVETNPVIKYFTNASSGTLSIGLETDGTTTSHSKVYTYNSTFEDSSTINVDVTSASTNEVNIAGDRLDDILTATNSLTINGTINVTDNSALLNFEIIDDANSIQDDTIDLQVVQGQTVEEAVTSAFESSSVSVGSPTATRAAAAIFDTVSGGSSNSEVNTFIAKLNSLGTNAEVAKAVESTLPTVATATPSVGGQVLNTMSSVVQARQASVRGFSSGDEIFTDRNVWFKPFGGIAEQKDKDGLNGFDATTYGFGVGVDGEYKDGYRAGLGLFYTTADIDVNNVTQSSDLSVVNLIHYGSRPIIDDKSVLFYQIGLGLQNTESSRAVTGVGTATADYNTRSYFAQVKATRAFPITNELKITPALKTAYKYFDTESYSEDGVGGMGLDVESSSSREFLVGVETDLEYKIDSATHLLANVGLYYDFENEAQGITSSYQGISGTSFESKGIENSDWSYELGIGVARKLKEDLMLDLKYDLGGEGSEFKSHSFSAKFTYKF